MHLGIMPCLNICVMYPSRGKDLFLSPLKTLCFSLYAESEEWIIS